MTGNPENQIDALFANWPPHAGIALSADARFRKLIESSLVGVGCGDKNGLLTYANDRFLELIGYTRAEFQRGCVRWDLITPVEFRALDRANMADAVQRGDCTPYEKEFIKKDGARVPILIGYAWTGDQDQQFIGFILDLTAQKKAESESKARAEKFRILAESLPQMIFTADANGVKTYCCPRYLEYTGVSSCGEMNLGWKQLVHPDDRNSAQLAWAQALATGQPYTVEYRLRRYDGEYRHHVAKAIPMRNPLGEITEWVGAITDIHESKQTDEVLRRTEKIAAAARIAASIAHEINNPLASVTNSLYLALQDPDLNPITRQYLQLADQELARVAQVTTQSLRFHKQSTAPVAVDVDTQILDPILAVFSTRFQALQVSVYKRYAMSHKLFCRVDELRQAFGHLLSNSCDAMPSGGRLVVHVREGRDRTANLPGVNVTIADTGIGIPHNFLPRILEAFTSTKDATGTGLGMWVVDGIIRSHNGRIAVRSRTSGPFRGTVISIFLPFLGVTDVTS